MYDDPVMIDDWHPVASASSLSENRPLRVTLLGEDLVIWQADGQILAWQDRCVHRGARLSLGQVDGATLICPYHGWTYNAAGRCVHIPAQPDLDPPQRAQVKTYQVQLSYDLVWVCLGEPRQAVPPFPEWDDNAFRKLLCGPYPVQTSGPRIVENFLDVAHFPFVHDAILGVRRHSEIADYDATVGPQGVEATGVRVYQPDPYGTGQGDDVAYTYRAYRPFTAYLYKASAGPRFSILLTITPHAPTQSTAWMWMAMDYGHDIPAAELIAWQDSIFAQDQPVLESQQPALLPLDPRAELSMRADRTAVTYRRWLKQLGLRFGVT